MNKHRHSNLGFTLVELLIVIVVIAILAAISIVAFNGVQERARDSQRMNDLAQIAKALKLYNVDHGNYVTTAGGCAQGGGWYDHDYDGTGPLKSMAECLQDAGYIGALRDPQQASKGCVTINTSPLERECFRYMKYDCGGTQYVFANLESMPHSSSDTDGTCMTGLDSGYGMNYYVRVN